MSKRYFIIAPCYNEEKVIERFLKDLETKLVKTDAEFTVVIVDDASLDLSLSILKGFRFSSESFTLKIIRLNFNMGHQAAINIGLNYVNKFKDDIEGVIVMDSDGEDDPNAIKELIKLKDFDIVFVSRGKRKEGLLFKVGYFFYKGLFKMVVGKSITFGNYSLINPNVLFSIHNQRFSHYAAFLSKQKFKINKVRFDRQHRIDGKSKMSHKNLVFHGLSSLIEYSEEILYFLIKFFFALICFNIVLGGYVLYSKFILHTAILGWASTIGSSILIICVLIISTVILGLLLLSIKRTIFNNIISYEEIK
ncbi:glycosyltransferase [Cellulophaga fucicola]|uniref:Glycosyltransferase involved in cell wall bisynthesis n=1 Tax=Cellulophaga fucicola TaxID=76595 RepID=A0A1K1QA86_9FLAO|nr:glycosyltransferase [Cellulophaga fucicola]SFW56644.1 Glycosyltransferase involved in cell wall bisynthesis [Cellulophaga fucicola]